MYKYPIEQCQVTDKEALKRFREKRLEWVEQLNGDDSHAIWRQIPEMLWNDTIFRVVNEARRFASDTPDPEVGFNDDVIGLFDLGFIVAQTTAIRRLTERWPPRSGNKDPNRAVYSLSRIIFEIKENLPLITRELYVAFDGLPYEPEPLKRAWITKKISEGKSQGGFLNTQGPNAWSKAYRVHKNFDRLSGVKPENRSPGDLIRASILDTLQKKLDECEDVCTYVDKFIAHGADPMNRKGLTNEQKGVSLNKLSECYKAIYQVAYYITGSLLWISSHGGLPTPQYDHLEGLDKKWVASSNMDRLHDLWNSRDKEIESWPSDCWMDEVDE